MYLAISSKGVALHDPDHVSDLYASYWERLGPERIAAVLAEHDAGELLDDRAHVMVPVAALRRLAAGRVGDGWDAAFTAALADAGAAGRLSDDGTAVRLPLERER